MRDVVRRLDPTRPVTVAMNGGWGRGFSTVVDVQGCNYFRSGKIDTYHQAHPLQPIFGSDHCWSYSKSDGAASASRVRSRSALTTLASARKSLSDMDTFADGTSTT